MCTTGISTRHHFNGDESAIIHNVKDSFPDESHPSFHFFWSRGFHVRRRALSAIVCSESEPLLHVHLAEQPSVRGSFILLFRLSLFTFLSDVFVDVPPQLMSNITSDTWQASIISPLLLAFS